MKSKILLIGNGPLPGQGEVHAHNAASLRTYFFKKTLDHTGCDLALVLIDFSSQASVLSHESGVLSQKSGVESCQLISKDDPKLNTKIEQIIKDFQPDGLVSVNTFPSYVASQLKTDLPLWCDLNGWVMAEAQSQAGVMKSDVLLPHYWKFEQKVLKRADRFSTVSTPQKFALIGELATMGRLNHKTNQEPLAHSVPNYFEEMVPTPNRSRPDNDGEFRVFWCGGYNTWVDEITLFKGLEYAMKKDPQVVFVSTGGTIKGLDDITFAHFKSMIDQSEFKDRFRFLGWVEHCEIPQLFADADCGINVDLANYESEIGARNRLNEMLVRGLPIITSVNAEITHQITSAQVAEGFQSGDDQAFGEAILKLKSHPGLRKRYSIEGRNFAQKNYDCLVHTKALQDWAQNPQASKDRGYRPDLKKLNPVKAIFYYLKKEGFKKTAKKLFRRLKLRL